MSDGRYWIKRRRWLAVHAALQPRITSQYSVLFRRVNSSPEDGGIMLLWNIEVYAVPLPWRLPSMSSAPWERHLTLWSTKITNGMIRLAWLIFALLPNVVSEEIFVVWEASFYFVTPFLWAVEARPLLFSAQLSADMMQCSIHSAV